MVVAICAGHTERPIPSRSARSAVLASACAARATTKRLPATVRPCDGANTRKYDSAKRVSAPPQKPIALATSGERPSRSSA